MPASTNWAIRLLPRMCRAPAGETGRPWALSLDQPAETWAPAGDQATPGFLSLHHRTGNITGYRRAFELISLELSGAYSKYGLCL